MHNDRSIGARLGGVIGTPLREGRDFTDDDIASGRNVTIIDERLAKRLWPEGAIGEER